MCEKVNKARVPCNDGFPRGSLVQVPLQELIEYCDLDPAEACRFDHHQRGFTEVFGHGKNELSHRSLKTNMHLLSC